MSGKRYPKEFKIEAVKQVVDHGHSVSSVATLLDITSHNIYAWIKKYCPDSSTVQKQMLFLCCNCPTHPTILRNPMFSHDCCVDQLNLQRRTSQSCPTEVRFEQGAEVGSHMLTKKWLPKQWRF